jgi:hypothetical protein
LTLGRTRLLPLLRVGVGEVGRAGGREGRKKGREEGREGRGEQVTSYLL